MTDRCEPAEHLRGKDGLFWVHNKNGDLFPAQWLSAPYPGREPLWRNIYTHVTCTPAWAAAEWEWRYHSPVATPAEVEALRAELAEWRTVNEAMGINSNQPAMTAAHNARALRVDVMRAGAECADAMAQVATLRATVRELVGALEEVAHWHEAADKALSKQPAGGDRAWRRMEHQEQVTSARAALARAKEAGL